MLVASPVLTTPPVATFTDELSAYGGVVYVGSERGKLGSVVRTVVEMDSKKDEMSEGDSE